MKAPKRQPAEVLSALRRLQGRLGMPPTIKELREELAVGSTRTVLRYLQKLETLGWVTRWPGARGIRINAPDGWDPELPDRPYKDEPDPAAWRLR